MKEIYELMHGEKKVARIDTQGRCEIYEESFLPYNLYLEETEEEIDTLVNNVTNFYYWCAGRMLTLDRKYAKEILNSIGAAAEEAVRRIGLHQIREVEPEWFAGREKDYEMYQIGRAHV